MNTHNSPLESLAAFAICFVAGVASSFALHAYVESIKRKARSL